MRPVWKIVVFALILVMFYIGFGAIINWQMSHIAQLVDQLHEHPMAVTRGALSASRDLIAISRNAKDMILVKDEAHRRKRLAEIELYEKSIRGNMNLVYDRVDGEEGKALVVKAIDLVNEQKALSREVLAAISAGQDKKASELARVQGTALMQRIEETMIKIANYAETQSMEYRVESTSDLRRSKVVLFSAGLIIAILSACFALLLSHWLYNSLNRTKKKLLQIAGPPLDLTARLDVPSIGGVNASINDLLDKLHKELLDLSEFSAKIQLEIEESRALEKNVPHEVSEITSALNPLVDEIASLKENQSAKEGNHLLLRDLFEQVNTNFSLLTELTMAQQLAIDHLKADIKLTEGGKQLNILESQNESLQRNILRAQLSLKESAQLVRSLQEYFSKILSASAKQVAYYPRLIALHEPTANCYRHLNHMKEIMTELQESLKSVKLT